MRGELKLPPDIADFLRREGVLSAPSLQAHLLGQVLCELRELREVMERQARAIERLEVSRL